MESTAPPSKPKGPKEGWLILTFTKGDLLTIGDGIVIAIPEKNCNNIRLAIRAPGKAIQKHKGQRPKRDS